MQVYIHRVILTFACKDYCTLTNDWSENDRQDGCNCSYLQRPKFMTQIEDGCMLTHIVQNRGGATGREEDVETPE